MNGILRLAVTLTGVGALAIGTTAWLDPAATGKLLGIGAIGPLGLNSIRADVGAFFVGCGVACAGAWLRGGAPWLRGGALLLGLAACGRTIGLLSGDPAGGAAAFVVLELTLAALLLYLARRMTMRQVQREPEQQGQHERQ